MSKRVAALLLAPAMASAAALLTAAIAWPLLALLLALDVLVWPIARLARRPLQLHPRDTSRASIVTVSWNGRHFLQNLLPSLRAAIQEHGGDHEVIVVDNGSTDGTTAWLASEYPWVKVVALPENRFFVRGNRAGVEAATRDVLVFLNNDMIVQSGFLGPLLEGLRDPRVFGVSAEVFFRDPGKRRDETGRTRGEIRRGWLKLAHVLPTRDERELRHVPTFWAGGGSSAFDRATYLELGGFDTLYDPFYMEDAGLSYAAWKRGLHVLFTARSSVLHEHRGTSRKAFGDDYVDGMIRRNQHLFLWRNITDPMLLLQVLGLLPLTVLARGRREGRAYWQGVWFETSALLRALPRLPIALVARCRDRRHHRVSDRAVAAMANDIHAYRQLSGVDLGRVAVPDAARGRRILVLASRLPDRTSQGPPGHGQLLTERLVAQAKASRITLLGSADAGTADDLASLRAAGIEVIAVRGDRKAMRVAVQRALEGTDHDLVEVEGIEMLRLLAGLPKRAPWICTWHEPSPSKAGWLRWCERRALRRCDRVVVPAALPPATNLLEVYEQVHAEVVVACARMARSPGPGRGA